MKKFYYLILIFSLYSNFNVAQVTIGSSVEPNEGALLQLTDGTLDPSNSLINSKRGLSMPRVFLNSLQNLDDIDKSNTARPDEGSHVGLVVYNMNTVENNDIIRICLGLHVWTGTEWTPLTPYPVFPDVKQIVHKTYPPNTYNVGWFGSFIYKGGNDISEYSIYSCDPQQEIPQLNRGKYWFTQNLNTKYTPSGEALEVVINNSKQKKKFGYPHLSDASNNSFAKKEYGLLYNYHAAVDDISVSHLVPGSNTPESFTNKSVINDIDGNPVTIIAGDFDPSRIPLQSYEVELIKPGGKIQGICPNGWHMPSQREWYQLIYDMTVGGQVYANIYDEGGLEPSEKKNTGWFMLTRDVNIEGSTTTVAPEVLKNYRSRDSDDNGFYGLLVGWYNSLGNVGGYGTQTWFRSSSTAAPHAADIGRLGVRDFGLGLGYDDNKMIQWNDYVDSGMSVRCVED